MYTIDDFKIIKTKLLATKSLLTEEERTMMLINLEALLNANRENKITMDELVQGLMSLYDSLGVEVDTNMLKEANLHNKRKQANPHTKNIYSKRR